MKKISSAPIIELTVFFPMIQFVYMTGVNCGNSEWKIKH